MKNKDTHPALVSESKLYNNCFVIRLLKLFLLLSFISGIITPLVSLGLSAASLIVILINSLIIVAIWKGLDLIVKAEIPSRKINIIRRLLMCYFSTLAIEVGILVGFVIRFFFDRALTDAIEFSTDDSGGWANAISRSSAYNEVFIILFPLLISIPVLYRIAKGLKFTRPIIPAVALFLIWELIIHLTSKLLNYLFVVY